MLAASQQAILTALSHDPRSTTQSMLVLNRPQALSPEIFAKFRLTLQSQMAFIHSLLNTDLNRADIESSTGSEATGMTQMTLKPSEDLFDFDHKLRNLLKDLEFIVSRLQSIARLLNSGVEISPERVNDLVRQARRCNRNLQKLGIEFKQHARSASEAALQPVKEQFAEASKLNREAIQLVESLAEPELAPSYRPSF